MMRRVAAILSILVLAVASDLAQMDVPLDNWLSARRMERFQRPPGGTVALVEIDARSIDAIGTWPWPRRVHASLIDRLIAQGAAEVAFDVDFSTASNEQDDALLEQALEVAGGTVVLATFAQEGLDDGARTLSLRSPIARLGRHAWPASVNVYPDGDGVVREYPYGLEIEGQVVASIAAVLGGGMGQPGRQFPIDFSIGAEEIDRISIIDVLRGDVDPARIAGKKIIVGARATELQDFFTVPVRGVVTGAMLQALATETILLERVLRPTPPLYTLAGLVVISLAGFLIGRLRWQVMVAGAAIFAVLIELAAAWFQAAFPVMPMTATWQYAIIALAIAAIVCEIGFQKLLKRFWHIRAENAEAILSQVVTDNFAGIMVIDESGIIRACSRAAAQILGAGPELDGVAAADVIPPAMLTRMDAAFSGDVTSRMEVPEEARLRTPDGSERILEFILTLSMVDEEEGRPLGTRARRRVVCLTFSDVTERRRSQERIAYMARYDSLTDLPNRNHLIEQLTDAILQGNGRHDSCAVVCFDLDGFKNVNDTLGHSTGDQLLCAVAGRARELLPPGAILARFGGDEFAAIITGGQALARAGAYAGRIVAHISRPYQVGGHRVLVGASAGVAGVPAYDGGPDEVLMRADIALYRAKADGGGRHVMFEPAMLDAIAERQRLERELVPALSSEQFEVWYQRQVDLVSGEIKGVEALLRWRHPRFGLISPTKFIPVAEATGMIKELGQWVLETACRDAADWPVPIKVAVNVSSAQFARSDMVETVANALHRSGLSPRRLDVEITESLFLQPGETIEAVLSDIRKMGIGIALDDFGTGYSSLSYLHRFPVDKIKIDRSFVSGLPADQEASAIVRAVAALARNMDVRLNAEGIETREQAMLLQTIGVNEGQGFLYGQPMPAAEIASELARASGGMRLRA